MQVSLQEAVEFVKARGLLRGWDELAIKKELSNAIKTCAFGYTKDAKGLTGLCFGYWLCQGQGIHIIAMTGNLKTFVNYLKDFFPQCKFITATRDGESIKYFIGKDL